ncbi:MAG: hypothetical protein ACRDMH_18070 [Solirubrobacterales bacterium]
MSQENVEIVRTLLEGFAHRQHERAFELYDPEIEWDASRMARELPDDVAGVYHGHEGVRAYRRNWLFGVERPRLRASGCGRRG